MTKCDLQACGASGAKWSPVLVLFAPMGRYGDRAPVPARAQLGLKVCDACREKSTVADFLSDEGFAQIAEAFPRIGKAIPDRSLTQLEWVEWDGSALQASRAAQKSAGLN